MSGTAYTAEDIARDPAEARFLAETLAEAATNDRRFTQRRSYQRLRDLAPHELHALYRVWSTEGAGAFREAFAPVYNGGDVPDTGADQGPVVLEEDDTSDRIRRTDDGNLDLDSMIEALEEEPDAGEIREALEALRADRVKHAVGETVRAAQFDRDRALDEFLADGEKSERTKETYRRECGRLFQWAERSGKHLTALQRADINDFKRYLSERYSANTTRLCLASCSSFFGWMEAEGIIESSPFARIAYPKRQYKKAVRADSAHPEVVPSGNEYELVAESLLRKTRRTGNRRYDEVARESAKKVLLAIHFMRFYGLRISSVLGVEVHGGYLSYPVKGGEVKQKQLENRTRALLSELGATRRRPLEGVGKSTIQARIRQETRELAAAGTVRRGFSAHDWRHLFAIETYRRTEDVYAVMRALDHSSVAATQHYLAGLGAMED